METIEKITIRCFFVGMAFVRIWFLFIALAGDWVFKMHSMWFDITRPQFDAIHYAALISTNPAIFIFFLGPYIHSM